MFGLKKEKKGSAGGLGRGVTESGPDPQLTEGEPPEAGIPMESDIVAEAMAVTGKKPKKQKKSKEAKPKGKAAAVADAEMQRRLSARVLIEPLPGFTKADAIEHARHHALDHCDNPSNAFYHVQKIDDGWMIEVQDGVGYSYLDSAIELAKSQPGRTIVVPMLRRSLTVHYAARTGQFDTNVLPEGQEPEGVIGGAPVLARRGKAMTPVLKQYREWMITGLVTAGVGCAALIASLAFYALDPATQLPPEWRTTETANLPVMQWDTLMQGDSSSYVVRMEFSNGEWRTVRQNVDAVVNVAQAVPGAPVAPDAGVVPPVEPGAPIIE